MNKPGLPRYISDELSWTVRRVYGEVKVYPNNPHAQAVCDLMQKKTVQARDLVTLNDRIGYELVFDGADKEVQHIVDLMNAVRDIRASHERAKP